MNWKLELLLLLTFIGLNAARLVNTATGPRRILAGLPPARVQPTLPTPQATPAPTVNGIRKTERGRIPLV